MKIWGRVSRDSRASVSRGPETPRVEGSSRSIKFPSIPQGPREALAAERRFLEPRTRAVVAGRESAHRQLDLRSEARATRPTARPGHRPGPRKTFPQRNRPTSAPADPVGTAAAAEPATTSSRRGLVARASASGDEGGGRGRHGLIHVGGVSTRAMGGKDPRTGRGGAQGSQSERRSRRGNHEASLEVEILHSTVSRQWSPSRSSSRGSRGSPGRRTRP